MFDLEEAPEAESIYECLKCGNLIHSDTHPVECPKCGGGVRNRAMSPE